MAPSPQALGLAAALLSLATGPAALFAATPASPEAGPAVRADAEVSPALHGSSAPLWLLPTRMAMGPPREAPEPRPIPRHSRRAAGATDPVLQPPSPTPLVPPAGIKAGANFLGVGIGLADYRVNVAPPDTNGAVGPNHYVQMVNTDFAVFDKKTGAVLYGPQAANVMFAGFGGSCEFDNDGDPVVLYDQLADRWVLTQFAVTNLTTRGLPPAHYYECVAVSKTGDPTGGYWLYAFQDKYFNDYPKVSLWPDAYYATFNLFDEGITRQGFHGGEVCAYDRAKMLDGQPATQQCFRVGADFGGLLAASLDGKNLPVPGAPNPVVSLGAAEGELATWKFHVDWARPEATTLTGPAVVKVAGFQYPCSNDRGTCVDEQDGAILESLGDRLMNRYAYRRFDGHESLVVNHTVNVPGAVVHTGVRWYELRLDQGGDPQVFQQGTFAPDTAYRWMGSVAMDQAGNLALGYSVAGPTLHPGLRLTGRLAADPPGLLPLPEVVAIDGGGGQSSLSRWGDYSSMTVDPTDDCTFFFTSEYLPATGRFNWSTRAVSFRLPNCPSGSDGPDFTLQVAPTSTTLGRGESGHYLVSGVALSGGATAVSLTAPGLRPGFTASFNPPTLTPGQTTSDLVLTATTSSPVGTFQVAVAGTSPTGLTHAWAANVVVTGNDFALTLGPPTRKVSGGTAAYTVTSALAGGVSETIALSVDGLPAGFTSSLSPSTIPAAGSSTLTLTAPPGGPALKATFTVTGTTPSVQRTATGEVVVPNDWSLTDDPTGSVAQGATVEVAVTTAQLSGGKETITFSLLGLPKGVVGAFTPATVLPGETTRLKLQASETAVLGAFTLSVIGTSATQSHQANTAMTVVAASGCSQAGAGVWALLGLGALLARRPRGRRAA